MEQPFSRIVRANICNHLTPIKESVTVFGETRKLELIINSDDTTAYCHHCLAKMAIQCAWCGRLIYICDPVTLYHQDKIHQLSKTTTKINSNIINDVETYTGCLRDDCADSLLDRAGFWYPPGVVEHVISPRNQVGFTLKIITLEDIYDIKKAFEIKAAILEPYKKYL